MRLTSAVLFSLVCLTIIAACGDDDSDSNTNSLELDAADVLERGADRWNGTDSARFELEIDGETYLDDAETIQLIGAEGALAWPSSAEAEAELSAGPIDADVSLIMVDGDVYMTDLLTGSWGEAPGDFNYDPSILLSEEEGLGAIMEQIENPEISQDDQELVVEGEAPEELVEDVTAGAITGDDGAVDVELRFDQETYDLLNISVRGTGDESWNIRLFDHNDSITIERPIG